MKFLFVEDEAELLELYEILLEDMEIDYQLASNGVVALEILKKEPIDYIFSDIRMPEMDGFELLENLKRMNYPIKKFIFITAHVDISKSEAQDKGADDILYKPLGHKELLSYIKSLPK